MMVYIVVGVQCCPLRPQSTGLFPTEQSYLLGECENYYAFVILWQFAGGHLHFIRGFRLVVDGGY